MLMIEIENRSVHYEPVLDDSDEGVARLYLDSATPGSMV
jgi:hypothetical protein